MTKEEEQRQRLIQGLTSLQSAHKEILEKYSINVRSQLNELLESLKEGADATRPSRRTVKEMLEELTDLKLKPEKGRGKDLYRIEKTIGELFDLYPGR